MPEPDFAPTYDRLRMILQSSADGFVVVGEGPEGYRLDTRHVRADGYRVMFGAVQTRKRYVSYHLMPVYMWPDLLDGVSDRLRARMQGKSCFNFSKVDEELFAELADLTRRAHHRASTEKNVFAR